MYKIGVYKQWMDLLQNLPVVSLVTTGRTGSDFLQSLLDSHPEIITFNGHFLPYTEFFPYAISFKEPRATSSDAADEFIGRYLYKLVSQYDTQEAKDCLGDTYDQSFRIDTITFKNHLIGLIGDLPLNTKNFILAVYGAYNLCLNHRLHNSRVIFHHPHLEAELERFLGDFNDSKIVFTTRDPRANFYSHVEHFRKYYDTHDNQQHILICLKMALEDSEVADKFNLEYTATRLEDVPREDVMVKLANWLGVSYQRSMLRSTWTGLDWHGDRISRKRFAAAGWSPTRTENGWQHRMGCLEKYVLNYIMYYRLKWYCYEVRSINLFDRVLIPILILIPFNCEMRLISAGNLYKVLKSGNKEMIYNLLLTPYFYIKRVVLCYKYYWRTATGKRFERNWIRPTDKY